MADSKPYLIRGSDGILMDNPDRGRDRPAYRDPGEAVKVWSAGRQSLGCTHRMFENFHSFPCGKTPKHDLDVNGNPTKCGVHSKAAEQRRTEKANARRKAELEKFDRQRKLSAINAELIPLVRAIAAGHNDPRSACVEWLARYDKMKEPKEGAE
jgi:hypothetical protein